MQELLINRHILPDLIAWSYMAANGTNTFIFTDDVTVGKNSRMKYTAILSHLTHWTALHRADG